jgi:ferredoxin-NADP reductase
MKFNLTEKRDEARGTKSFFWQPKSPVSFAPGQYLYYTLPHLNYPDARGATRSFTIASSPTENNSLRLTTRIRQESGYKKTLDELPIGTEIETQGPNGTFIFDEKETGPHIFLAGGIGITPFRSMIKYVADRNLKNQIYLIYSNSDSDITFKKDLDEIAEAHPNIKIQYIISSVEGHLDEPKISKLTGNWKLEITKCICWLCGPPPFIDAVHEILTKMGVPSGKIRFEKFTGY